MSINLVVEILLIIITTIWEGIKIIFKLISPFFKNIPTSLLDFIKKDLSKNGIFFDNVFITKIIIFVISSAIPIQLFRADSSMTFMSIVSHSDILGRIINNKNIILFMSWIVSSFWMQYNLFFLF